MKALDIVNQTAQAFALDSSEICGMSRKQNLVLARQTAMYVLWQRTDATLAKIGKVLGNRTPATVSWGYRRISQKINTNPELRKKLEIISESL